MKSLRKRLLFGTTVAVAAVLALAGWALYALVERSLVGEVDRALIAKARLLSSMVQQEGRMLEVEFEELDMWEFSSPERGGFLQLWRAGGETLYRSPSLGEEAFELRASSASLTPEWIDLPPSDAGARGRAVTLRFQPRLELVGAEIEEIVPEDLTLVLARDAREAEQALATLKGLLVIVGLVTLAAAGVVLVWVVRRSLRPVAAVSERIATIGEQSLSTRLEADGVPDELFPVVQRVNGLLARLEAAFTRERSFSHDVAHELRTPLAGLRTTLEVAGARRRSEQEYAGALQEGATIVKQLQSMVERLLQLARLDAGRSAVPSERYDLADLALEAWEPFAAQAVLRGLRVDLLLEEGLEISADRELVGLILRNLYENAVSYADPGGKIRIATRRSKSGDISLGVSNTGSRLGREEARAATQRFWRGDAARTEAGAHCGLGLTLVEKATHALGGSLRLASEAGGEFAVEVAFPPGPGPALFRDTDGDSPRRRHYA